MSLCLGFIANCLAISVINVERGIVKYLYYVMIIRVMYYVVAKTLPTLLEEFVCFAICCAEYLKRCMNPIVCINIINYWTACKILHTLKSPHGSPLGQICLSAVLNVFVLRSRPA